MTTVFTVIFSASDVSTSAIDICESIKPGKKG